MKSRDTVIVANVKTNSNMKRSGFKNKYSPLKRTGSLKRSGFKRKAIMFGESKSVDMQTGETRCSIESKKSGLKRSPWLKKKANTPQAKLDTLTSEIVRRSAANEAGYVKCATCPAVKHWKEMQCGHFRSRQYLATRYLVQNLAPQCEDCNCFYNGRPDEFACYIDEKWGRGTANLLIRESQQEYHNFPYQEFIVQAKLSLKLLDTLQGEQIQY